MYNIFLCNFLRNVLDLASLIFLTDFTQMLYFLQNTN